MELLCLIGYFFNLVGVVIGKVLKVFIYSIATVLVFLTKGIEMILNK